ncbi:MAG: DUF4340 domain-containing protein [Oscillospiraceae bacterium]|nr:DUF4340 domain-containing protein [Oscillospiraceae bacterium]
MTEEKQKEQIEEEKSEEKSIVFKTAETNIDIRRPGIFEGLRTASTIKKQGLGIGMSAGFFLVLIALYFGVLQPVLAERAARVESVELELLEGETINESSRFTITPVKAETPPGVNKVLVKGADSTARVDNIRIMITPRVDRADIRHIEVFNRVDSYRLVHHLGQGFYYVETAELALIDPELLSQFLVNTGYLLSMMRVAAKDIEDGNEILENKEQFGFSEDNAYFIVTKTDGSWYKIIIGDIIPTQGGHYVMYEDELGLREAIYILDRQMDDNVLSDRYSILAPVICRPLNNVMTETMYIDNFRFYDPQGLAVEIYNAEIPEDSPALLNRQMRYPAPYEVSDNLNNILTTLLAGLQGERVVYAFGADIEDFDESILEEYGLFDYACRMTFDFIDPDNPQNSREYYIIFSRPNEEGNYYAFSLDLQVIVEIAAEDAPFVEWDWTRFVDRAIFMRNIDDVEAITVRSPGQPDVTFTLEGTRQELIVKGGETGGTAVVLETQNFRQFYKAILSIDLWELEENTSADSEPFCEFVVDMRNGDIFEYAFYFVPSNTRRSFFTVNGSGQFHVMRDRVLKLINDTALVLNGEPVNADAPE